MTQIQPSYGGGYLVPVGNPTVAIVALLAAPVRCRAPAKVAQKVSGSMESGCDYPSRLVRTGAPDEDNLHVSTWRFEPMPLDRDPLIFTPE
jgi:hypothetical protein